MPVGISCSRNSSIISCSYVSAYSLAAVWRGATNLWALPTFDKLSGGTGAMLGAPAPRLSSNLFGLPDNTSTTTHHLPTSAAQRRAIFLCDATGTLRPKPRGVMVNEASISKVSSTKIVTTVAPVAPRRPPGAACPTPPRITLWFRSPLDAPAPGHASVRHRHWLSGPALDAPGQGRRPAIPGPALPTQAAGTWRPNPRDCCAVARRGSRFGGSAHQSPRPNSRASSRAKRSNCLARSWLVTLVTIPFCS